MKTSLNETREIDDYLHGMLSPEDATVMNARLLLNPALRLKCAAQRRLQSVVRAFGRRVMRQELQLRFDEMINNPAAASLKKKIVANLKK